LKIYKEYGHYDTEKDVTKFIATGLLSIFDILKDNNQVIVDIRRLSDIRRKANMKIEEGDDRDIVEVITWDRNLTFNLWLTPYCDEPEDYIEKFSFKTSMTIDSKPVSFEAAEVEAKKWVVKWAYHLTADED
jgi:hypothetical protein